MRYLVFGDIHGNLLALDAVLAAGQSRGAQRYLCTGDIIGYGPDPLVCIHRLLGLPAKSLVCVAGHHELAVRAEHRLTGLSEEETRTLEWTGQLLAKDSAARKFIRSLPTTAQVTNQILLTHDSLAEPGCGRYTQDARLAKPELACLRYRKGRVCFHGHAHVVRAELAEPSGELMLPLVEPHFGDGADPHPVRIGEGEVGWVGVGSVGFPGNERRWPEFLILDDREWQIEKYAVEYDREAARARAFVVLEPVCGAAIAERIAHWM